MHKIALAALLALSPCALAQTADYESARAAARAPRFDSGAELSDQSRAFVGKTIELRGNVKGIFSRGGGYAVLLQLGDDSTILLDASAELRANALLKAGKYLRVLCRVDGMTERGVALTLLDLTDRAERIALLKSSDDNSIALAPPSASAPTPDAVLLRPEMDLPGAPTAATGAQPDQAASVQAVPAPRTIAIANAKVAASTNPYYGFSETHRQNYSNFIRRANPKIAPALADYIAASILSASQAQNLDPRFLCAVVQVESTFDPTCLSSSGAMGLGQLMPFNLKPLGVKNAWDPMDNLHGSAKLLRRNLDTYAAQKDGTLLAVAAYHAGVGAVNRAGLKVPKATTQRYVWKVYYAYRALAPELFN